jgi:hypothetical protein
VHENGCQTYPRDVWASRYIFMHFLGWPSVIIECLLQSYTGQIRVAPVKIKNPVRFARLRAAGGFLVSGEFEDGGEIAYLAITSEAGEICELIRPWEEILRIRLAVSFNEILYVIKGDAIVFPTEAGSTYIVDHPGSPWEERPVIDI